MQRDNSNEPEIVEEVIAPAMRVFNIKVGHRYKIKVELKFEALEGSEGIDNIYIPKNIVRKEIYSSDLGSYFFLKKVSKLV